MIFKLVDLCLLWSIGLAMVTGIPTPVTVQSKAGNIMGFQDDVMIDGQQKTITKFLGIPFGESTAGVNKFMKPVPKPKFTGTFDARTEGNSCYQGSLRHKQIEDKSLETNTTYSDDCLQLNIYIPGSVSSNSPKAVMIWIFGGGFVRGTTLLYKPDGLVSYGDVIVVTVNYRVNMFGFLRDSQGNFPGNQGLWDQQLAIKWVHDNIESFNGIKENITIFGESSGSASVLYQAMYPGNRGLFQRVIAQSGTPFNYWTYTDESKSDKFIKDVGCDNADMVRCLQSKDSETFVNNNTYSLYPVIDNDFVITSPSEIVFGNSSRSQSARDFFSSLDIIVGVNNQEDLNALSWVLSPNTTLSNAVLKITIIPNLVWYTLVSGQSRTDIGPLTSIIKDLLYFTYTNWQDPMDLDTLESNVIAMNNDADFFAGVAKTVNGHVALGSGRTYLYEIGFDVGYHASGLSGAKEWAHADDIPYVLGYPLLERPFIFGDVRNFTRSDNQLSKELITLWTNFAKSGDPNTPTPTSVRWPEYTASSQEFLTSNTSWFKVGQYFHPQRMSLWNDIIPSVIQQSLNQRNKVECTTKTPVDEILVG